jgi:hypothetical protein
LEQERRVTRMLEDLERRRQRSQARWCGMRSA